MYEEQVINVWVLMVSRPFVLRLVLNDCIHTLGKKKASSFHCKVKKKRECCVSTADFYPAINVAGYK